MSLFALFIYRKKSTNRWLEEKEKKKKEKKKMKMKMNSTFFFKTWTVHIEQTNTVTFTHSSNKCHNIFTKHLFSVVVGHSFIFYYFILTYKKLTPQ